MNVAAGNHAWYSGTVCSSRQKVEEAWKWVDSITEAWAMDNDAPKPYQAGTWGPVASVAMITVMVVLE